MKIPRKFTIYDLRFTIGGSADRRLANRRSKDGIALVITLIMLAVTLVMMVAFMALARRETKSVGTTTDNTVARLATDMAMQNAEAQIAANFLSGFTGVDSSNAYSFGLIVSTNYINPIGYDQNAVGTFTYGSPSPTNVNYDYTLANVALTADQRNQTISNLWFLPRAPVFFPTNQPVTGYDFRYYLDLNENGRFETNGWGPVFSGIPATPYYDTASGNLMSTGGVTRAYIPPNVASVLNVGDPEWIGVLEHPDQPHGPNNHFTSRYAFIAVPVGNDLDVNYIGNEARNTTLNFADGFMRNQGVGSWEINLAAFLADLNTNSWSGPLPLPNATYYSYNEPFNYNNNSGYAFQDALALLKYRYYNNITQTYSLPSAGSTLFNAPLVFPYDGIDAYSDGPLQTTLDTNMDWTAPNNDGDWKAGSRPWPGADNPNHFFTPSDFLDASKVNIGAPSPFNSFTNRLRSGGNGMDTYGRYAFYRLLQELGTDSAADDGKLDLNYSNAVVTYANANGAPGVSIPVSVGVVVGAETNLVPWTPQNFFNAASDRLVRLYTAEWFQRDPSNYLATYYGYNTRGRYIDATGLGVTNFPNYGVTNQIPAFGLTNIPVMINGSFVYSPAVNRLLQLAANLYDASTNNNFNYPHIYRPIFEHDRVGNLFVVGYTNLWSGNGPNTINGLKDPQLAPPYLPQTITNSSFWAADTPIVGPGGNGFRPGLVNVYGVPWIIGAKKGFPSFNQLSLVTAAQVTRKLEVTRSSLDPAAARYGTNQEYIIGISNTVGVTFWNSFSNDYVSPFGNSLTVVASDVASTVLTNAYFNPNNPPWELITNFTTATTIARWPGSKWSGTPPIATPQNPSFLQITWPYIAVPSLPYDQVSHNFFLTSAWEPITQNPQMDHFGLLITNYLQAYILDGNYVLDYVHFRDPIAQGDLNQALADPNYPDNTELYYQWSTNAYRNAIPPNTPDGIINQIWVSGHANNAPTVGSVGWLPLPTPMGTSPPAEAAYFGGFFTPTFQYLGKIYANHQLVTQAPYTPSRAVYTSYLMQANDPLVHYLASDLNSQVGTLATWAGRQQVYNGFWYHSDDLSRQPLPTAPTSPIGGRYQPWGLSGQMAALSRVDTNQWNLAYKDPLAWGPDYWDFPTNAYPSVGWIGRVHRGSPWQTVDLKSTNILWFTQSLGNQGLLPTGSNTWAAWTGDIQQDLSGHYYDAANAAPMEDRLLFDIFTTRFNDNAARGTLPVNVGVGTLDGGLAAWSALFSGMEVLSNLPPVTRGSQVDPIYSNLMINPAGVDVRNSVLAQIVASINTTRANANVFPYHGFTHVGDVLQAPALSEFSPFLNERALKPGNVLTPADKINYEYGAGDEAYEWLPQQMMGLVRGSEQRYVLYCFGQTLHPAPNGTVLSGTFFQLVTNYQVTAESAARAVIRVDNANTSKPRIILENYNTLPPN